MLRVLAEGGSALERKLAGPTIPTKVSFSMLAFAMPMVKVESEFRTDIRPRAAWGWGVRQVKGDHRKILMRLLGAKQSFERLDLKLRKAWDRG